MPYIPTLGYGIATSLAKGLSYKKEYDEAEALKQRQMKINEDAEKRARDLVDESIATSKNNRKKDEALAESTEFANSTMYGIGKDPSANPSTASAANASTVTPESVSSKATAESASGQPEDVANDNGGTIVDMGDGRQMDTVTGQITEVGPTTGKKGAVPKSAQKPGDIVRTGGLASKDKPGGYGLPQTQAPAGSVSQKAEDSLRQGKSQVAPTEVTGMFDQANKVQAEAEGIETRLNEALKTIQSRYSGDETMAKYLKSNVIAKVRPQIEAMKAQSAQLRQGAQLAQFTHDAGLFSEGLLGKLETTKSPAEVDAWLNANADTAKKLGIDLERFKGLHKAPDGTIRNKEGYVFPRAAIMASANAALPFTERLKYMKEADDMYKIQEDLRNERMRIAQQDPLRVEKWTLEQKANFARAYAKKDYEYDEAKKKVATGGEFTIMRNGQEVKVAVPPQYKPTGDWLGAMRNSDNPDVREVHKQVINQLELDRSMLDTVDRFLGGFRARVQPVNESTIERDNRAARDRSYGVTAGKLQAAAESEEKAAEASRKDRNK